MQGMQMLLGGRHQQHAHSPVAFLTGLSTEASTVWGSGSGSGSATCQPALPTGPLFDTPSVANLMACHTRASCIHGCLWSMMVSPTLHVDIEAQR